MKIAVIGAGAIGSVVAGYLYKAGMDVVLIGRQDQVDAIKQNGLKIKGVRGEETIRVPAATKLSDPIDLGIFTTKTQDIEAAYQHNAEYLENTDVLSTQNGVQADNILSSHYDRDRVTSSIVMFGATYIKPGEVTFNFEGKWIIGRPFVSNDPETEELVRILSKGFSAVISHDIIGMKWLKLFVNFNNCIPGLIGKSMQETFADLDLCRLSILLLKEGLEIVQKSGVEIVSLPDFPKEKIFGLANMPLEQAAGIINKTLTSLSKEPLYGSILQSIMRKKTSEIDYINGEVVYLAKHVHMAAPLNNRIVDLVHEVENRGKFFDLEFIKKEFQLREAGAAK